MMPRPPKNRAPWPLRPLDALQPTAFSSGALSLDLATGCGGYPRGQISEIYGPESSGKTTLALHAIAACQALGGVATFIDAEHALDPAYAQRIGVVVSDLLIAQPEDGEQALAIAEGLMASGGVSLVVVDSVAALVPRAELRGDADEARVGLQAHLMSQAMRRLSAAAQRANVALIFLNQLRQKIDPTWGSGEVTVGGSALKFYASLRLEVRRIGALRADGQDVGSRIRVRTVKNRLAPPFQQVALDLRYGQGLCGAGDLLDLAEQARILQRSGSDYALDGVLIGQGRDQARAHLLAHPHTAQALRLRLLEQLDA